MEPKVKKIIWSFGLGIPLVCALIIVGLWPVSATMREGCYLFLLDTRIHQLEKKAARELKNYPSMDSLFSLIRFLNRVNLRSLRGQVTAEEALYSLCVITRENFGTDFQNTRRRG